MSVLCDNCKGVGFVLGTGGMRAKCVPCDGSGYVQDDKKTDIE